MDRVNQMRIELVEFIPSDLENGVLYASQKYKTAVHLCCCGCGNKVVTPLKDGGWRLAIKNGIPSLAPSIGSWSLPCKSHYWIKNGRIVWAEKFSQQLIDSVRVNDQLAREQYVEQRSQGNLRHLRRKALEWVNQIWQRIARNR